MKITGLMMVWGAGKFIDPAIEQALDYCDELHIYVGTHSDKMFPFKDHTYNRCLNHKVDSIVLQNGAPNISYSKWRAQTLNGMLKQATGDWIYLVDVDEFIFKKDFENLKTKLSNGYDSCRFEEKYFIVNMKRYITKTSSPRIWKRKNKDHKFRPTDNWTGPFENTYILPRETGVYHYSLLCNPYAKIAYWGSEYKKKQDNKTGWMKDVYLEYDLNKDDHWVETTYKGFESDNGRFFTHEGKHPEMIEKYDLPQIEDFRKIYDVRL